MIWDEFLRHFRFCDEEDSGLSDEEQERKGPKNRPKHIRKRIHQAKKNFLKKFKTASNITSDLFKRQALGYKTNIYFSCRFIYLKQPMDIASLAKSVYIRFSDWIYRMNSAHSSHPIYIFSFRWIFCFLSAVHLLYTFHRT